MDLTGLQRRFALQRRIARFSEVELPDALSDAQRLGLVTMLGDHDGEAGEFWNVSPADADVLERHGYERSHLTATDDGVLPAPL